MMPKTYVDLYAVLSHLNDVWYAATPTDSMPEDVRDRAKVRSEGIREAMEAVARFPAADVVEVRHGRWEFTEDVDMPWCTKAVCTSCGVPIADNIDLSQSFGRKRFIRYNRYCPDCGARMDGDGE